MRAEGRQVCLDAYRARFENLATAPRLFFHAAADYGPNERLKRGIVARSGVQRNVGEREV